MKLGPTWSVGDVPDVGGVHLDLGGGVGLLPEPFVELPKHDVHEPFVVLIFQNEWTN